MSLHCLSLQILTNGVMRMSDLYEDAIEQDAREFARFSRLFAVALALLALLALACASGVAWAVLRAVAR